MKWIILVTALAANLSFAAGLYEKVEESVAWPNHGLANPFTETELRLSITAPAGRTPAERFEFFGFHDGDGAGGQTGGIWKFRIMLDKPGEWKVTARFVDPATGNPKAGAPAEKSFTYSVQSTAAAGEHGHVRVDPNNAMRFAYADGTPWIPFPVHASMLMEREVDVAKAWIDAHAALGVNAMTVRFHSEISEAIPGNAGSYHFLLKDGKRTTKWPGSADNFDYTRFDVSAWAHNEGILEYARGSGIKLSIWFGISGMNRQYWSYGPLDNPNESTLGPNQKLFIRYFLARWAANDEWWHWTIDSEYDEAGSGALAKNRAYAAEMRALNPWKTLLTTHVLSSWTPGDSPEFDFVTLQKRVVDSDAGAVESQKFVADNLKYNKPVYNAEGVWNLAGPSRMRIATMAHLMAGGFSHMAFDAAAHAQSSWGASWSTVSASHKESAAEMGKLANFFNVALGVNLNLAGPRSGLVTEAAGRPAVCLAGAPNAFFVWLPEGGNPTLDLSGVAGNFSVSRYSGANLALPTALSAVAGGAKVNLGATPSSGAGNDYLFVIKNKAKQVLAISISPQLTAVAGMLYRQPLTAQNAKGTVNWKVSGGSLPLGLALLGNALTGTVALPGTHDFNLSATDDDTTVSLAFRLTVRAATLAKPPAVSGITALDASAASVTIAWTTDVPAGSRVQWGSQPGNYTGESGEVATGKTQHAVRIAGNFAEGQTLYLLILSADSLGLFTPVEASVKLGFNKTVIGLVQYLGTATPPQVVERGFMDGAKQVVDREANWIGVPEELSTQSYLLTARDDKNLPLAENEPVYQVKLPDSTGIFALVDGSPVWLSADGWKLTGFSGLTAQGATYRIYSKAFAAGIAGLKRYKNGDSQGTGYVFANSTRVAIKLGRAKAKGDRFTIAAPQRLYLRPGSVAGNGWIRGYALDGRSVLLRKVIRDGLSILIPAAATP